MLSRYQVVDKSFYKPSNELGKYSTKCTMGRYKLINELQNSIAFKLYFKCDVCNRYIGIIVLSERKLSVNSVKYALFGNHCQLVLDIVRLNNCL